MKPFTYTLLFVSFLLVTDVGAQSVQQHFWASAYSGQALPKLNLQQWFNDEVPDWADKQATLLVFWTPQAVDGQALVDSLNTWQNNFAHQLKVIAVTDVKRNKLKHFFQETISFYLGIDSDKEVYTAMRISGLPYAFFLNEKRIVTWEGYPFSSAQPLNRAVIKKLLHKE